MSNVSPHFSWAELTRTGQTALQAANTAEAEQYRHALTALAKNLLEPIRAKFGPIKITSAFRGPSVNAKVGGAKTSQHLTGEAADISAPWRHECPRNFIHRTIGMTIESSIIEMLPMLVQMGVPAPIAMPWLAMALPCWPILTAVSPICAPAPAPPGIGGMNKGWSCPHANMPANIAMTIST